MIRIDCRGVPTEDLAASEQIRAAADCFTRHGYAILDNVVAKEKIERLHREFLDGYSRFLKDEETDEVRQVGYQRYMLSLKMSGGFADPDIFANPYVVALVRQVLEASAILEAFGLVVSLPGAPAQVSHFDGPHLFASELSVMLPAYALTFALPLIEMNEHHGTTSLSPGSHRWRREQENQDGLEISPLVPTGSCLFWDFRLRHRGTTNRSTTPRPMLYCTYSRPWYKDPVNFLGGKQMRRVDVDPSFVAALPESTRHLFAHLG